MQPNWKKIYIFGKSAAAGPERNPACQWNGKAARPVSAHRGKTDVRTSWSEPRSEVRHYLPSEAAREESLARKTVK